MYSYCILRVLYSLLMMSILFLICSFSEIYCEGDLLHTIQMAKVFNDSKTFVDMKLRQSPEQTVIQFKLFMEAHNDKPTKDDITNFINVSAIDIYEK